MSVLSTCMIPRVVSSMTEEEFVATIRARHQGRLMRRKLRALHHIAKTSIGIEASAWPVSMEISFLVEKFSLIKQHIRTIAVLLPRYLDSRSFFY